MQSHEAVKVELQKTDCGQANCIKTVAGQGPEGKEAIGLFLFLVGSLG